MKNKIYPKNKESFKRLIPFAKEIIVLCKKNNIPLVIYGSFAHFYHTRDENMKVNDIDIIISKHKKSFPKLLWLLEKEGIRFEYYPKWETMIIRKGELRVEMDSVNLGYTKAKGNSLFKESGHDKIDFYGVRTNLLKLKDLEEMYPIAYKRSKDNKSKILKKIKHLEKFLGRRL